MAFHYDINSDLCCSVSGITSDANVLISELRLIAQRYYLQYQEQVPCENLVANLCNIKQAYTQFGGKRPFGVSILYMGWDKQFGYQLYQSDPSGNYGGWKATCIGNNNQVKSTTRDNFHKFSWILIFFLCVLLFRRPFQYLNRSTKSTKRNWATHCDLPSKYSAKLWTRLSWPAKKVDFNSWNL